MLEFHAAPAQELRAFKKRVYLLVALALLLVTPIYYLALSLSLGSALLIFGLAIGTSVGLVEIVFFYDQRMRLRIAYPSQLGISLAAIRTFPDACQVAVNTVAPWLRARAAVVAWLSEDGDSLEPIAAFGVPAAWKDSAARLAMGSRTLREYAHSEGAIRKPSNQGDPWFGFLDADCEVVYIPLLNGDVLLGVLAVAASGKQWELRDHRLLAGLSMVMSISLDNSRLYEGQRERAEHMQQLAQMKSSFLTTISHELRTPLTSIKVAAEMLQEEEDLDNPEGAKARLVRNIVKGAERLSHLVSDLMDASKRDDLMPRLELEPANAEEVVSNALAVVYPIIAAKRQHIDVAFDSPGPPILVDRPRFEQVLVNLLANANRFTPVDGHLRITVREAAGEVIIAVADSGPGVPADQRSQIFEPFYRGDSSGMGMGLAIAKGITEMHRGRIWVEPNGGTGSVFSVALPRYHEPVEREEPLAIAAKT